MNPKLAVAFVLLVIFFCFTLFWNVSESYNRALYRTQNIDSISLEIDTTLIKINSPGEIERFTQLMLRSTKRVRSTTSKIIYNRITVRFSLKDDDEYALHIGSLGKDGNVIELPFRFYRADSLFQLIDSLYYKFPPGTPSFPLFQNKPE